MGVGLSRKNGSFTCLGVGWLSTRIRKVTEPYLSSSDIVQGVLRLYDWHHIPSRSVGPSKS